jgi:hypothetical protein
MLPQQPTPDVAPCQASFRWPRSQAVSLLEQALHQDDPPSLCVFAEQHAVPRSTLHYWKHRRNHLDTSEALRTFFESAAGLDFLQGLVLAAHVAFHQTGASGIRPLSLFFELARLQPFLACSYGAQQRLAGTVGELIVEYGQTQRRQLAPSMPARSISLCEDENFHKGPPCLEAIEPVSNFLVVETCSEQRDAESWGRAVEQGLAGLPVKVVQVGSDQAPGIVAHAKDGLGAHHSPDLMRVQRACTAPRRCPCSSASSRPSNSSNRPSCAPSAPASRRSWPSRNPGPTGHTTSRPASTRPRSSGVRPSRPRRRRDSGSNRSAKRSADWATTITPSMPPARRTARRRWRGSCPADWTSSSRRRNRRG